MKAVVFEGQSHIPGLPYTELISRWEPLKKIQQVEEVQIIDSSQHPGKTQRDLIGDADIAMDFGLPTIISTKIFCSLIPI